MLPCSHPCSFLQRSRFSDVLPKGSVRAQPQDHPADVTIAVTLPTDRIHVNDELIAKVETANRSNGVVFLGSGRPGGIRIELRSVSGADLGPAVMGDKGEQKESGQAYVIYSNRVALAAHSTTSFTFHFQPLSNALVPGKYQLRVHRVNTDTNQDIVSNSVELTVTP